MKWIKQQLVKGWFWIGTTILFLVSIQILFRIEAPCKWLDAVWEAGDLISFIGTLVLGYVAVLQTQRANDMAADANETSRKLIELQKAEYTPVVTVNNFAGITKHTLSHVNMAVCSEIIVHEMRCSDGEVLVGHSISLIDDKCDLSKKLYCRDYEIHMEYSGHFVVESFQIKEICFAENCFEKKFQIKNKMEMSLGEGEKFDLFLLLFSNEDFMQEGTSAYQYTTANYIIFEIEMKSISGELFKETIKIRKLLVNNPDPDLEFANAEMLVSASYQVRNENVTEKAL